MPLHGLEHSAELTRAAPPALPFPAAADVLEVFRVAGCHGTNWFRVLGEEPGSRLPECPSPSACAATGGLDLGEVTLRSAGGRSDLAASTPVEIISFRKPYPLAVLTAACALTAIAGSQVVFDQDGGDAFVIQPGEEVQALTAGWPW